MARHSFTRQQLYEQVWTEPLITVAARLNISGTALAKACARGGVPVPPLGYWSKLRAGRAVKRPPLPGRTGSMDEPIVIAPPIPRPKILADPPTADAAPTPVPDVKVPQRLTHPHRIVAAWLQDDRDRAREARRNEWSQRQHEPVDGSHLKKRRLRILNGLFVHLERNGYALALDYPRPVVRIIRESEKLQVSVGERIQHARRPLTPQEAIDNTRFGFSRKWRQERVPTGRLELTLRSESWFGFQERFEDREKAPLEAQLGAITLRIQAAFQLAQAKREREVEEARRQHEREQEQHRLRLLAAKEQLREEGLLQRAKDWRLAADLREFVTAVGQGAAAQGHPDSYIRWRGWALEKARALDPTRDEAIFDLEVSDDDAFALLYRPRVRSC